MRNLSNIGKRELIFEKILMERGNNRLYWEMLCSTKLPLVPFIGAGLSAWRYPTWNKLLLDIGKKVYQGNGFSCIEEAMKDGISMDEIAECIFNNKDMTEFPHGNITTFDDKLLKLWAYVGYGDKSQKVLAQKKLYEAFSASPKENVFRPQYQDFIPRLFPELLVTTNYDKLLDELYDSILIYSYKDLNPSAPVRKDLSDASWLFKAVNEKLRKLNIEAQGKSYKEEVTLPNSPMLLKIHGNIERIDSAALTTEGYHAAYQGELPLLMENIFRKSTVIFMGCSLADDRVLENLKKLKSIQPDLMHFAFMRWEDLGSEDQREKKLKELKEHYGIHVILFSDKDCEFLEDEIDNIYNFFYGLLLENLYCRKLYSSPYERIGWGRQLEISNWPNSEIKDKIRDISPKHTQVEKTIVCIRNDDVKEVQNKIIDRKEHPQICIYGVPGSGKTTFCNNVFTEAFIRDNSIRLFNISLKRYSTWDDFCQYISDEMNLIQRIPKAEKWEDFAKKITEISWSYWHTVILIEHIDHIENTDWKYVKNLLDYWKKHEIQVVFTCDSFPKDISCYVWKADRPEGEALYDVFCDGYKTQSQRMDRTKDIDFKNYFIELFKNHKFITSSTFFLGKLAGKESDLDSFIHSSNFAAQDARKEEIVPYLLFNRLKKELPDENERALFIKIWKILKEYPGNIPYSFLEAGIPDISKDALIKLLNVMLSWGICTETYENQDKLLMDVNTCVKQFFYDNVIRSNGLNRNPEGYKKEKNIQWWEEWILNEDPSKWMLDSFKKYQMAEYVGILLEQADRYFDCGEKGAPAPETLFELLKTIGKKVFENAVRNRYENQNLNLILHQEIKSVITFLGHRLRNKNDKLETIEVIVDFSHYYHYVSGYSYTFVKNVLLELNQMYIKETDPQNKIRELYFLTILYRVRGDIQRTLGKHKSAVKSYHRVQELANIYILSSAEEKKNNEVYRIGGEALLVAFYYKDTYEKKMEQLDAAKDILEKSGDSFAVAYCYQKKGETLFSQLEDHGYNKNTNLEKIFDYYQEAADRFGGSNKKTEVTAISYINKCRGDLALKTNSSDSCIQAAYFYMESFALYCKNVNWQGVANVLQAMGTCCRMIKKNDDHAEKLYLMAKECYKMLGDTQGLGDTLDYLGHNYKEKYDYTCDKLSDNIWLWKALNAWKESRYIWKNIHNDEKEKKSEEYSQMLLQRYKNTQWEKIITPPKDSDIKNNDGSL